VYSRLVMGRGISCIESCDLTVTMFGLLWGTEQINCKRYCPKYEHFLEVIIRGQHMFNIRLGTKIFYSLSPRCKNSSVSGVIQDV